MHFRGLISTGVLATVLCLNALPAHAVGTAITVKGSAGQTLTASQARNLSVKGQVVTITGRRYDETVGIYVAMCVVTPKGTAPTPCGGGIDKSGTTGASQWVSSNPPPYGVGLAIPYTPGGGFRVKLHVGPMIGTIDCRKVKCAILTKADHLNEDNRSADVLIPVTFAKKK